MGDPVPGYIARWTMDDGTAADETGTYDGTWAGATGLTTITGKVGNAQKPTWSSTTSGYAMTAASLPTIKGGLRSLAGWIKVHSNNASRWFDQKGGFSITTSGGSVYLCLRDDTTDNTPFYYALNISAFGTSDTWAHLGVVSDGVVTTSGTFAIYINGEIVAPARAGGGGTCAVTTNEFKINGKNGLTSYYADVAYDDVRLYDFGLSSTQMAALYAMG